MDKQDVEFIDNGILFSLKKEGNSDTHYNMDELYKQHTNERNETPKTII